MDCVSVPALCCAELNMCFPFKFTITLCRSYLLFMLYYKCGAGNTRNYEQVFCVQCRIVSAVKRVEFVSDS